MKTRPIVPARIEFGADGVPHAPEFGDVYHARVGALEQARHVFLAGNGLPKRWAGHDHFVVLETGFGLGHNFLATWDAWRADPARCGWLHFVAIDRHPPTRADLARAHAASALPELSRMLLDAWPPLTPNLHPLSFDGGRVRLLLGFGDIAVLLPALHVGADAFYLDGFAPARNPAMWEARVLKALARRARPGATAATWSVARGLTDGLTAAGFVVERRPGIGGKREITTARFEPRFTPRAPALGLTEAPREAVVVGAGLAGAGVAHALAGLGVAVTVLERHPQPAQATSGNAAGIFHGTVNEDDGPHARLFRACALAAQRSLGSAMAAGVPGQLHGLLRLDHGAGGLASMQATLLRQGLPEHYVQALEAARASSMAGLTLTAPAWFYPGGGWVAPPALVERLLSTSGVRWVGGVTVDALQRAGTGWQLLDSEGRTCAEAAVVVLANAADAARLLGPLGHDPWPLRRIRGQVSQWHAPAATPLRLPLAGDGYAIPLPDAGLLFGATRDDECESDANAQPREADHRRNLERLHRLTGRAPPRDMAGLHGRVGWRLEADDRLPVVGAMPAPPLERGARLDQTRLLARAPGLFVATAYGSRGLTLAPLTGALLAAQITGTPWPLEQDLADAIDPGRWIVRHARRATAP
jgi:tRNA 5-methylaminomethyl-2-thiouridine biosynthesis bifunctional protein